MILRVPSRSRSTLNAIRQEITTLVSHQSKSLSSQSGAQHSIHLKDNKRLMRGVLSNPVQPAFSRLTGWNLWDLFHILIWERAKENSWREEMPLKKDEVKQIFRFLHHFTWKREQREEFCWCEGRHLTFTWHHPKASLEQRGAFNAALFLIRKCCPGLIQVPLLQHPTKSWL